MYVRRSQIYRGLRSRKLAEGHYIVEREATSESFYVFKRSEDWALVARERPLIKSGYRKKDDIMLELAVAS